MEKIWNRYLQLFDHILKIREREKFSQTQSIILPNCFSTSNYIILCMQNWNNKNLFTKNCTKIKMKSSTKHICNLQQTKRKSPCLKTSTFLLLFFCFLSLFNLFPRLERAVLVLQEEYKKRLKQEQAMKKVRKGKMERLE